MLGLWRHQEEVRQKAFGKPGFGLLLDAGVGKTGTTIYILRDKYNEHKELLNTLIVCPPIVIDNWKREFAKFSKIPAKSICPLLGTGKKRLETFKKSEAKVFIINYEVLSVASMQPLYEALKDWGPTCIVFDESHRVKDMKSKRTKRAIALADVATYKYILTGTPILNSLMDIFSQFRILDGGGSFGKNFFSFRGRYFYDKNAGMARDKYFPDWIPRKGAAEDINKKVGAISMHITKDECLDLPPLVRKTIYVEMSKQQEKLYNDMKRDFIAFINDEACVAQLAITKALRLQQIVTGYMPVEKGQGESKNIKFKENPRQKALQEVLADITPVHKVIVWAVFKENYNAIREVCENLKIKYVEVHGGISNKQEQVDTFTSNDEYRVFIGHPGSGGIGLNIVEASHMVFYSRSFSLEYDIQAEARNYRAGSERHDKVTRIDLVTKGTIDEMVLESLAAKTKIGMEVLGKLP